jgi:transcriptional regulator of acetoin/glycerol metabolism
MPTDLGDVLLASSNADRISANKSSLADYEKEAIRRTLVQTSGNRRVAAKLLNISEATLYRRIREYDL